MTGSWQILRDGGVPIAAPTTGHKPSAGELVSSARAAIAEHPRGRDAEALAAWLLAWRDHWPGSFRAGFGADVALVQDWARQHADDAGRYIKLRRIAIENLASIL